MTVINAIKTILNQHPSGLTCKSITSQILKNNLYLFNSKDPNNIVNHAIRRHCEGLDFPTAHPVKYFRIASGLRGNTIYQLLSPNVQQSIPPTVQLIKSDAELLPVERMQRYYSIHKESIKNQLLEYILNNDPAFFESMVVDLLIALGYGYGVHAGQVVGKSHDGGIDGIINEDQLCLDKIYIQAKRYTPSQKVGSKELQAFVGAMKNVHKGVFITTSSFTNSGKSYIADQQQKSISLIDGNTLVELMVEHGVGVKTIKRFSTYEIDNEFFEDV